MTKVGNLPNLGRAFVAAALGGVRRSAPSAAATAPVPSALSSVVATGVVGAPHHSGGV